MENSDLIMRALQSHALALESEIMALRSDARAAESQTAEWKTRFADVYHYLWPDRDGPGVGDGEGAKMIIAELQRRGVMNGGMKP